jgi:hypothetical protein
VRRHAEIVRGLAHELSTAPDRVDRPKTAAQAKQRWDAHLASLAATPRAGLAAPTGQFIDDLIKRSARYDAHLFHCFDDPRIPANTNRLERFFGVSKQALRHSLGCGSTTNTVVANLGAEPLLALHQLRQPGAMKLLSTPQQSPADFHAARARIAQAELPAIHRRSIVRHLDDHLVRLRSDWLRPPLAEADA